MLCTPSDMYIVTTEFLFNRKNVLNNICMKWNLYETKETLNHLKIFLVHLFCTLSLKNDLGKKNGKQK